jgi:hypothetical protein
MSEARLLQLTGNHAENPTLDLPCREVFARGQKAIDRDRARGRGRRRDRRAAPRLLAHAMTGLEGHLRCTTAATASAPWRTTATKARCACCSAVPRRPGHLPPRAGAPAGRRGRRRPCCRSTARLERHARADHHARRHALLPQRRRAGACSRCTLSWPTARGWNGCRWRPSPTATASPQPGHAATGARRRMRWAGTCWRWACPRPARPSTAALPAAAGTARRLAGTWPDARRRHAAAGQPAGPGRPACAGHAVVRGRAARLLAPHVEAAMRLLQAVRAAWRLAAWGLQGEAPRVWRT